MIGTNAFVEMVVWQLPAAVSASDHIFKYRLAFVVDGVCVLRYDNEAGKGDHRHIRKWESAYQFTTPERQLADFWNGVENTK